MQEIISLLQRAARTGETLITAYASGSRRGLARPITVVNVSDGEWPQFRANEPGELDQKTYASNQILWVQDQSGNRIENKKKIASFSAFLARAADDAVEIERLRSNAYSSRAGSNFYLREVTAANPAAQGSSCFSVKFSRSAVIEAINPWAADRLCESFDFIISRSQGKIWDLLGALLHAKFIWPAWIRYLSVLRMEGVVLRHGRPTLRERQIGLNDRGNIPYEEYSQQQAIYEKSRLRPEEEEYAIDFFDRVRLFEADPIDLPALFQFSARVPATTLSKYLAATWNTNQMVRLPDSDISTDDISELLHSGLVCHANRAPVDVLLRRMNASSLYAPIKARGVKLPKRGISEYRKYYAEQMDPAYEAALRETASLDGQYVYLPPPNMTWEQLQDFRTCYVEMTRALLGWLVGNPVRKAEEHYYGQFSKQTA